MLANEDFSEYTTKVILAKRDILSQMVGFKNSKGDVADCYKKIVLDKLWQLSRVVGEHYLRCLSAIAEVEDDVLDPNTPSPNRYQIIEMEKLLEETNLSDSPSVELESEPSLQSQPSLS